MNEAVETVVRPAMPAPMMHTSATNRRPMAFSREARSVLPMDSFYFVDTLVDAALTCEAEA